MGNCRPPTIRRRPAAADDQRCPCGAFPGVNLPVGNLHSGSLPGGSLPGGSLPGGSLSGDSFPSGNLPGGNLPVSNQRGGKRPGGDLGNNGNLLVKSSAAICSKARVSTALSPEESPERPTLTGWARQRATQRTLKRESRPELKTARKLGFVAPCANTIRHETLCDNTEQDRERSKPTLPSSLHSHRRRCTMVSCTPRQHKTRA